eukprot:10619361-Ditylum_brightwellii.AAC.1
MGPNVMRSIHNATDLHGPSPPPNQQFYYCNTSTLIKRLQQNQYNKPFPNQCSLADYDVYMTLWSIIDQNLGNLSIIHVKGHQDCKKVTCPTKLTWVARLNIWADHLATKAKLQLLR